MTEQRCLVCGCPQADHIPLRYAFKAWALHRPWVWRAYIAAWVRS